MSRYRVQRSPCSLVLVCDGGTDDGREVALSQVRLGSDKAAKIDCRLQGKGLRLTGITTKNDFFPSPQV